MNDDDDYSKPGDLIIPRAPRIGLRVSGARVGDAVRPRPDGVAPIGPTNPLGASRRPMLRANASRLGMRSPEQGGPGDDEAAS